MDVLSRVFPSLPDKKPFQGHLPSKTILSTQQAHHPGRPEL